MSDITACTDLDSCSCGAPGCASDHLSVPPDLEGTKTYQTDCQCGEWTGSKCCWRGQRHETAAVEYMPAYLRSSHEAAGNRGIYPHNGAVRAHVARSCADEIIAREGDWAAIVG